MFSLIPISPYCQLGSEFRGPLTRYELNIDEIMTIIYDRSVTFDTEDVRDIGSNVKNI